MDNLGAQVRGRVSLRSVTYVKRHFPYGHGKIQAVVGQEVVPSDILGEGQTTSGFRTIYLSKELNLPPKQALACLKRDLHKTIYKGELLASFDYLFGLKKKVLLSPVDGILDYYDFQKGELRLKLLPKALKLVSGVYGVIEGIDQERGTVLIRTLADLVFGVVGTGKERGGILEVVDGAGGLISSKQISEQMEGKIIAGGGIFFSDALEKAMSVGVGGFVCGGMESSDLRKINGGLVKKRWEDVGLSLLVTEGFGFLPIGADIFSLLKAYHGNFVFLDGNLKRLILPSNEENCIIYIRRTKLPLDFHPQSGSEIKWGDLKPGEKVRVVSAPFLGLQGVIISIDKLPTLLPSGIKTFLVTVETDAKKIKVPFMNLEIIE